MNAWRLIVDDGAGAAEGLATDEFLMHGYRGEAPPPPTLRLYTYRNAALVGRFQDPAAELHLDACTAAGVEVNRRPTGGGAIVMGPAQLGVALVTSLRDPACPPHARAIIDTFGGAVARGLARLGVDGEVRGKNDIAVRGRKITGLGVYIDAHDAVLFHASVLADLDVEHMLRVLNVPVAKLGDRASAGVRERITTVSGETGRPYDAATLRPHLAAGFAESFAATLHQAPLGAEERAGVMEIVAQRYGSDEWISHRSGEAPTGTSILKTGGGLLRIAVGLAGDAIKDVVIAGDFMARDSAVAELEAALRWTGAHRSRVAAAILKGIDRGGGLDGVPADQLVEAVWQAVVDARARTGATGSCYYPPITEPQEAMT